MNPIISFFEWGSVFGYSGGIDQTYNDTNPTQADWNHGLGFYGDGGYEGLNSAPDGGYGNNDGNSGGSQDDSGYSSGGDSSYPDTDGSYGSVCGGSKTLSGFVYLDANQSGTYNDGDAGGVSGQRITVHTPTQYTPAILDENGVNVVVPGYYTPGQLVGETWTDGTGHYSISGLNTGNYEVRHYNTTGYSRTNPTEDMIMVNVACNRYRSFGLNPPPQPSFTQHPPVSVCFGNDPSIGLSWSSPRDHTPDNYKIHFVPSTGGDEIVIDPTTTGRNYEFSPSSPNQLVPGTQYSFVIESLINNTPVAYSNFGTWSHQLYGYTTYPGNCASGDLPVITLSLNGGQNNVVTGVNVDQNGPANLTWSITNANPNSCVAAVTSDDVSPLPQAVNNSWTGTKGPPSLSSTPYNDGPQAINTATPGKYRLKLTCSNTAGNKTESIQMNVRPFPRPYFQTTGGGVHSNENINLTP